MDIVNYETSRIQFMADDCFTDSCQDTKTVTREAPIETDAKFIDKRSLCNSEVYITLFTPPQHLLSTKWVGTALYQVIDRQLRDAFRKTALCRWLTPRLLLWKQGDWRYWGGGLLKDSEQELEEVPTPAPSLQLHNLLEKRNRGRERDIDQ